jgi:hypothetical protein
MRAPTSWVVFGCTGCGGVWTDAAAAKHVEAALDAPILALAERAAANFADRPLPNDVGGRGCPTCGGALRRVKLATTDLDVCRDHGTWFDRGELERVARVLEARRASEEVERGEGSAVGEVGEAVGDVAVDVVIGILGGVVESLL